MHENSESLITSDYVLDETLTLLRARGREEQAQRLGRLFFEEHFVCVVSVKDQDLQESWKCFRDYADKGWSFTDCTSKVLMERMKIESAFAFDRHFNQFGSIEVLP